jgi:uncharacterized membrane protein
LNAAVGEASEMTVERLAYCGDVGQIIGGFFVIVGGVALLAFSSWLHQPGFAGDPNVRLLDGAPYGVLMFGGFGLLVAGFVLIRREVLRRHRTRVP